MVGPRTSEAAVSSVVGTVLMLGITVSVFAGVSVVVLGQFDDADQTPRSELGVVRGDAAYLLRHQGGDPIRLDGATLLVGVGAVGREVPMTDFAGQTADGETWRLGETLCVSCLFSGQDVTGVQFATADALLLSEGTVPTARLVDGIDLQVDAPEADPDGLRAGQQTVLRARITNVGRDATGTAVAMEVLVDGASVGTVTGTALDGGTAQWLEVPWTATTGVHAVSFVADPLGSVPEADEADNAVDLALTVVPSVPDPGFAYEDVDLDGEFADATDVALARADLEDGTHDAGANGLVVPASWGPLSASAVSLSGAHVEVHGDVTAQSGGLLVTATGGDVELHGDLTTLTSGGGVSVQATGAVAMADLLVLSSGAVTVQGASVDLTDAGLYLSASGAVALTATSGSLLLDDAIVEGRGALTASAATLLSATGADVDLLAAGATTLTATTLHLADATLHVLGAVTLDASGDMDLSDLLLRLQAAGDDLYVDADGALAADGADVQSTGLARLEGGTLTASGLRVVNTGGTENVALLTTTGALAVPDAVLQTDGHVSVDGQTGVDADGATLSAPSGNSKNVIVTTVTGNVDVEDATLTASKDITLQAPAGSVLVQGATFVDKDDTASVAGTVVGVPASGGTGP